MSLKQALALTLITACMASAAKLAVVMGAAQAYPQEKRRVYEKPVFQLGKGEVVELVKTSSPLSQVRTRSGRVGWIETTKLDTVNRPPILSLRPADTIKAPPLSVKEDSALMKKWIETQRAGEKDTAR